MAIGKRAALVAWLGGIAAIIGLTVWSGADLVGQALLAVGAGTVLVVIARALAVAGAGVGWWLLFPQATRPALTACVLLRFVREAANALLPLAQIGGDVIGARCLSLYGTAGSVAAASVIVDVLVQAATQFAFALIGVLMLMATGGDESVARTGVAAIAVAMPALSGFFLAQRPGGRRILKGLLARLSGGREWLAFAAIDSLYARLDAFYARRGGIASASIVHLAVWCFGAIEVWIVLSFMGYAAGYGEAVIIESLMHAVRGAAFAIPGALGVQEGGLIVLCAIFGLPPEAALAMSLVKRVPDLVLGVPGLLAWQAMEGRHRFATHRHTGGRS
jgi:putative membrane protein